MPPKPLVNVIMNCLNSATYLAEAINSVYAQDMDDWEIIFFDNNSTDNSAAIARSYDSRLHYFKNDVTIPLGAARNLAIAQARGKYLTVLDCDDLFEPSKVSKQVAAMSSSNPGGRRYGMAYCDSMRIDANGNDLAPFSYEHRLYQGRVFVELIRDCFIDMSTCFIDREVFEEVGGFNESYDHVEDWDLWLRIARKYDIAFVNEILVKTRIHPGNLSRDFGSAASEKVALTSNIICETPAQRKARAQTLAELKIRDSISHLLSSGNRNIESIAKRLLRTSFNCFRHPLISCQIAKKYASPRMFRLYRHKYIEDLR